MIFARADCRSNLHQKKKVSTLPAGRSIIRLASSLPAAPLAPLTFLPLGKSCEGFIRKEQSIAKTNGKTHEKNSRIPLWLEKRPRNAWRRRSVLFNYNLCVISTGIFVRDCSG